MIDTGWLPATPHRRPYLFYLQAIGLSDEDALTLCFDTYCRTRDGERDLESLALWLGTTPNGARMRVERATVAFYARLDPNAKPPEATCEVCGEVWQPQRKDARFCSAACRKRASRAA